MPAQYIPSGGSAREIADDVEAAVRERRLSPGSPLPTIRSLASSLGSSPTTVASAYRELRMRGIAKGRGRAGTVIVEAPPVGARVPVEVPPGTRNVAAGSPDPALLPELPLGRIPRRAYDAPSVSQRLEKMAAEQFAAEGIEATNLAVVGGALDGVERVLAAWLRPGDRVAVEDPCYSAVLDLISAMAMVAVPMPVDEKGVTAESLSAALRRGVRAAVFTPRAQNPTGAAWDQSRLEELSAVLGSRPEVLVVEDDHAGPIAGAPPLSLGSGRAKWATIRSVSKSLGPDLRLATLVGDATTVGRVEGRQSVGTGWVSYILQETVADLWEDPRTQRLLRDASAAYSTRRRHLGEALRSHGISATGVSGLTTWVRVEDEAGVVTGLMRRGWAVAPGERFRIDAPPGIRIGFATMSDREAWQLAESLSSVLNRKPRRSD